MKQKTKVAMSAFSCGVGYASVVSGIMHNQHWTILVVVLFFVLFVATTFIKAYSDE